MVREAASTGGAPSSLDAIQFAAAYPAEDARIADPVAGSVRVEAEKVIRIGSILDLTRVHFFIHLFTPIISTAHAPPLKADFLN